MLNEKAAQAFARDIDAINEELARWDGGVMRVWTYSVSHGVLTLRIGRWGTADNIHLRCFATTRFCGNTSGAGIRFRITAEITSSKVECVLADEGGAMSTTCQLVEVEHNVPPLYGA